MSVRYVPMQEWVGADMCVPGPRAPADASPEKLALATERLCMHDHIHPSAEGYLRMASAFGLAMEHVAPPIPSASAASPSSLTWE